MKRMSLREMKRRERLKKAIIETVTDMLIVLGLFAYVFAVVSCFNLGNDFAGCCLLACMLIFGAVGAILTRQKRSER